MQQGGQDPRSMVAPSIEFGCMRCGTMSPRGGSCETCLEALEELRALDEDFATQRRRQALPWHPSLAASLPS
jgi:hypothetical protein